mmetsp:Transcript_39912/g.70216  ORF Transcript_39912/g.70216 Transcript_39912/m.70216 type:complete len:191 (+) Transcript_39912:2-574(+)
MARRIHNRTRLEQFHFSELMTSRPTYHSAFISHLENTTAYPKSFDFAGLPWCCEDRSWMHKKTPVVLNAKELQFQQSLIPFLQRMAVFRQSPDMHFELSRDQGRAMAKIQLPVLAFAFVEASLTGSRTAAKIIGDVHSAAQMWAEELNATLQAKELKIDMEPLSYQEVEDQFCDWAHKMEATVKVLWIHV